MADFTVVLTRKPYHESTPMDCLYVATRIVVDAEGLTRLEAAQIAVSLACAEVCDKDREDGIWQQFWERKPTPKDYEMLCIFSGHHDPTHFGFGFEWL